MSFHESRVFAALCLLVMVASYGCGEYRPARGVGPSPVSFGASDTSPVNSIDFFARGVSLQPASIIPQPVARPACPEHPPFRSAISIVANAHGASEIFLSHVEMQFVDRAGVVGGSMTFAEPQLVELFGSTRIPSFGSRSFPFSFGFGCAGNRAGTLAVIIVGRDSNGRERRVSLTRPVR
jgi:hypothetical protein